MKHLQWVAWALAGLFFAIAAVGGSHIAPFTALICGFVAGLYGSRALQPNTRST